MIFCYSVIMIILYSAFLIIRYYGNSITVSLHKIGGSSLLLWEPAFFPKWYFQGYQAALREKRYTQQAGGSGLPPADPTEGSLSTHRKAVGGSIPPDVGTYQAGQEKGSHGANTGLSGESIYLSGKVLFCSVEAPLPSGYSRHHERAELRRQAPRWGSGLPPADPTEGSLSERNKIYGYFHKQPYNQNVSKIKNIVTIRAKQRNKFTSYSCSLPLSYGGQPQQLTESRRRLYPSRCGYLLGTAGERLSRGRYGAIWGKLQREIEKVVLKIL